MIWIPWWVAAASVCHVAKSKNLSKSHLEPVESRKTPSNPKVPSKVPKGKPNKNLLVTLKSLKASPTNKQAKPPLDPCTLQSRTERARWPELRPRAADLYRLRGAPAAALQPGHSGTLRPGGP